MLPDNIWNFWSSRYDSLLVQSRVLTPVRNAVLGEITRHLETGAPSPGLHILDMGCGTGQFVCEMADALSRLTPEITGVDYSAGMIEAALKKGCPATFLCTDAETYSPGGKRFDVVACLNSFPYYQNQETVLKGFFRMLKPGGLLILAHASVNTLYDRLVMLGVKLTVSRSKYLSIPEMKRLSLKVSGAVPECRRLPLGRWIPSICMFTWRGSK